MSKSLNNYLKILMFLKEFESDGVMHNVEDVLSPEVDKGTILVELAREGLITLDGGTTFMPAFMFSDSDKIFSGGSSYSPYIAKLTFKGSKYLKEELEMIDNNRYNIHIGDNSTANLIMNSPGSTIDNNVLTKNKIDKIIETLKADKVIDESIKTQALQTFSNLNMEISTGKVAETTWKKIISMGSNIASIGSLVLSLLQEFTK